jgi:hypothetical protein
MSRLQFNLPQVSPLGLLSSAALSLGSQHLPRDLFLVCRRSFEPQQPDSASAAMNGDPRLHPGNQLSCAKQSTACFAAEIVTQGVHPKGKPVLNDGTAILNFFANFVQQRVTK